MGLLQYRSFPRKNFNVESRKEAPPLLKVESYEVFYLVFLRQKIVPFPGPFLGYLVELFRIFVKFKGFLNYLASSSVLKKESQELDDGWGTQHLNFCGP